jgi:hypothetical protein
MDAFFVTLIGLLSNLMIFGDSLSEQRNAVNAILKNPKINWPGKVEDL